ncbi:MAG TPA: hypothetical protein VNN07_06370, partial [Candidatus Tectomicrobia bacterium]|nr:hypothetical protein [Candidatus Tectomicrobia bacterium]
MRIVVLGIVGRTPLAGVAWQALHYLEGFRRLGHEVHYVEDTRAWPYDPVQAAPTPRCDDTVAYLARVMQRFGFGERWAYRGPALRDELSGLSHGTLRRVFRDADVAVDVTGSTPLRDEHRTVPARILVETDTHHFTFGANVGAPDCPLPPAGS